MSERWTIRPRVEADIDAQVDWLRRHRSDEVALAWLNALRIAFVAAAENPLVFPI